jgi:TRAP-type mannitol/chloroaromatic compound transport system permease small subunit
VVIRYVGQFTKSDLFADVTGAVLGTRIPQNMLTELQWYMFSILFLLGFGYILKHGVNVRVDFLYSRWSARRRALVDFLGTLLLLIPFCLIAIFVLLPQVIQSLGYNSFKPLGGPNPIGALFAWLGDLRPVLNTPVGWIDVGRTVLLVGLPSVALALISRMKPSALRGVLIAVGVAAFVFLSIYALRSFGGELSSDPGGLPRAPIKSFLVIGFSLLLIQAISQAIKYLAVLSGNQAVLEEIKHDEVPEVEAVIHEVQERAKDVKLT